MQLLTCSIQNVMITRIGWTKNIKLETWHHWPTSKVQYAHSTTPRPLVKSQLWTTSGGTCEKDWKACLEIIADFHLARFFDILRFFVISVSVVSVRSLQMDWHEAHHSARCARPSYTACLGLSKNRARTVPVLCCHRCSLWGESEAGKQSNPQANPRAYAENDMKNSSLSSLSYILSSLQPFLGMFWLSPNWSFPQVVDWGIWSTMAWTTSLKAWSVNLSRYLIWDIRDFIWFHAWRGSKNTN